MCILKIQSASQSFKAYAEKCTMPIVSVKDAGEVRLKAKGELWKKNRISFDVSDSEWNNFPGSVDDAIVFLTKHKSELEELMAMPGITDACLDFALWSRLDGNFVTQTDFIPPDLMELCGALRIGIMMSIYDKNAFDEVENENLDRTITDYTRIIETNPEDSEAYFKRGTAKGVKGDLDGAIADLNRAIEINPKYGGAYTNIGLARKKMGDLDGAIAAYNRAIEFNPEISEAYSGLADCNYLKSNWVEALSAYRRNSELTKHGELQDYCQLSIWIIRTRLGEGQAADKELADHLEKGWNSAPNDWVSKVAGHLLGTVTEADLFAAAGTPESHKADCQFCEAWYYAGMKKILLGDKKAATEDFRKCLATKQNHFTEFKFAEAELNALAKP